MNAPKINQTVAFEKPLNPHFMDSAELVDISPKIMVRVTPIKPIAAAGRGSKINPKITDKNIAKKYQAFGDSSAGTGSKQTDIPTKTGIPIFIPFLFKGPMYNDLPYKKPKIKIMFSDV
jgi:hypothetical protein